MCNASRWVGAAAVAWGLGMLGCSFDWEAAYAARFGSGSQGGTPAAGGTSSAGGREGAGSVLLGGTSGAGANPWVGGSAGLGATQSSGGASTAIQAGASSTGGIVPVGGNGQAGGAGIGGEGGLASCSNNLLINPGFEEINGQVPRYWTSMSLPSTVKGEVVATSDLALEGTRSLFVDTTNVKKAPADYVLLIASSPWAVAAGDVFRLSAAAEVIDPVNPIRVTIVYYDAQGALIDVLATPGLSFSPPSAGFMLQGPIESMAPAQAAAAGVGVLASTGVTAYVDSICLTQQTQ